LIEVPGEEAATDPGEGRQPKVEESANRGPLISGLVAAAVVLAAVGYWHTQQVEPVAEDGTRINNHATIPLSHHQNQTIPGEKQAVDDESVQAAQHEDRSERRNRTGGRVATDLRQVAEGRVIPKSAPMVNPLDAFAVGAGPTVRGPQGIVLDDLGKIEAMVDRVLSGGQKRLGTCYKQKVSVQPGYTGVWWVSVNVARDGSVESVQLSAREGADSGMERCIRSHVKRWTFQRIAQPISSSTVYRFGD